MGLWFWDSAWSLRARGLQLQVGVVEGEDMSVQLFQLLGSLDAELRPSDCKVHLAVHNGAENPLDLFVAGEFDRWQAWQNGRNFNRDRVVALIALPERDRWLFAGVFKVIGVRRMEDGHFEYDLQPSPLTESLNGRAVVQFSRAGRQSYLIAENWAEQMVVAELRPERMRFVEFPGYGDLLITKQQLDQVVEQRIASWRSALASVGGVYVIADRFTGKLYVGSASGEGGIWDRWCSYAATGHGGNRELLDLLREKGAEYAEHFQFGILEIASPQVDILARESHWKRLLGSRGHGYNRN